MILSIYNKFLTSERFKSGDKLTNDTNFNVTALLKQKAEEGGRRFKIVIHNMTKRITGSQNF